jgi:sugar-specific transcriptional regulator TrmB
MTTPRTRAAKRPFETLGITDLEERASRLLLAKRRATAEEIAHALPLSQRKTQQLLDTIEAKGLATHSPERPRRYIPASPNIAMESLILEHQKDLQRARTAIQELQEGHLHASRLYSSAS